MANTINAGCFPTGRHYPGIADRIAKAIQNVAGLATGFSADQDWRSIPLVVIDFETTGRDSKEDRIIEVGMVGFTQGKVNFSEAILVNPTIPVPEESRAIHGISDEELVGAPTFAESVEHIFEKLEGRVPVAYNADFDKGFFLEECKRAGVVGNDAVPASMEESAWIDPLVWAREILKELKSKRLGDVAAHFHITLEQAHRAAGDAEATGHVLFQLAKNMPTPYGELIRLQTRYAAFQQAEMSHWKRFK